MTNTTGKSIRTLVFYVRQSRCSYFELCSSVFKLTYVIYVRREADEHKAPRPPCKPARLCLSADVSAR
jgi:hypothetical protein